ncbi:hypothetical protein SNE40_004336 [Patella caerulea]|uniref:G-protein coupled receptors family 1 profile domain-containing protein n=1 Tax=Patella caerulea TaxID=87958 RepID=A0AAN8K5H6_PATCE
MNTSNSSNVLSMNDYPEYKASVLIWKICSPVLIIIGTIGNLLSILVLTQKNMRKSSVSIYLTVLSIVDILVLYTGLLRQTIRYHLNLDIRELSVLSCKINTWLVYFTLDMSVWLLVAVTGERIISVWFPHRVRYACTNVSSSIVISIVGIILLAVNSHFLYGIGDAIKEHGEVSKCESLWENYNNFVWHIWPWVDLCFFCLVPFTILIIGNASIIIKVCSSRKNLRRLNTLPANTKRNEVYRKQTSSMTLMLLCLNMVFLTCTSPISVYLVGEPYWTADLSAHGEAQHALIWAIVNILMYTNNSINFLLYCISGTRFREELKNIFRKKNRIRPQVSLTNVNGARQVGATNTEDNNAIQKSQDKNITDHLTVPNVIRLHVPIITPKTLTVNCESGRNPTDTSGERKDNASGNSCVQ